VDLAGNLASISLSSVLQLYSDNRPNLNWIEHSPQQAAGNALAIAVQIVPVNTARIDEAVGAELQPG
jgi:hypothetical protein